MYEVNYSHGQKVFSEGENLEYVYFVKEGDFEFTKKILEHKNFGKSEERICDFLWYSSSWKTKWVSKTLQPDLMILFSESGKELENNIYNEMNIIAHR